MLALSEPPEAVALEEDISDSWQGLCVAAETQARSETGLAWRLAGHTLGVLQIEAWLAGEKDQPRGYLVHSIDQGVISEGT